MGCKASKECIETYTCSTPKDQMAGFVYSPFVELSFPAGPGDNRRQILTVGNQSSPKVNLATITSFNYGFQSGSQGLGAKFEILDSGGAMYRSIIRALNKSTSKKDEELANIQFDFGWIVRDSVNSSVNVMSASRIASKKFHGIFTGVDTSFEGGNVKIKLELGTPLSEDASIVQSGSKGSSDAPMNLKTAIRQLMSSPSVRVSKVSFQKHDSQAPDSLEFAASDGGKNGPRAIWPMDRQSALSTVRMWLSSVTSKEGRGLLFLYNTSDNSLVIKEDPTDAQKGCCVGHLATYVINGGNCSPVLSFNPTINWPKGFIPGGGGTAGGSSGGSPVYVKSPADVQKVGSQTSPSTMQHEWTFRSPEEHGVKSAQGNAAHMQAAQSAGTGGKPGWECDLKIIGDPFYSDPLYLVSRGNLSILFINPFFYGNSATSTWLQTSTCSSLLSNKKYKITGVSHDIQNGSYTTSFKLMLPQPNIDIDYNEAVGGDGCGSIDQNFSGQGQGQSTK